jgi:hypothetical protein
MDDKEVLEIIAKATEERAIIFDLSSMNLTAVPSSHRAKENRILGVTRTMARTRVI